MSIYDLYERTRQLNNSGKEKYTSKFKDIVRVTSDQHYGYSNKTTTNSKIVSPYTGIFNGDSYFHSLSLTNPEVGKQ